jgi:predicted DNA-binding transcriptional regulator AlpA
MQTTVITADAPELTVREIQDIKALTDATRELIEKLDERQPIQEMSANSCARLFEVTTKCWYEWVHDDPAAPKPVHEAPRFTRWDKKEVREYQALLIRENRTGYGKRKAAA